MVVNGRPMKRVKRRVTADLYDFFSFPSDGAAGDIDGPFRSNIQVFLSRYARLLPPPSILSTSPHLSSGNLIWRVGFGLGNAFTGNGEEALSPSGSLSAATVEVDIVEEDVPRSKSIYCDQCRVVGWSCHPVCRKRYHFIIRNNANPLSSSHLKCLLCGVFLQRMDSRCPSCNYDIAAELLENWAHHQLEDPTHLLHGLVHSNGYGHLLRVNGRDGGSRYLAGSDILDFWDRLCKMLRVRKITVMDISKKHGMEYRLLNAMTVGQPWYGHWGYKFGAGSYGVTAEGYQDAMKTLADLPLSLLFSHTRSQHTMLRNTVTLYSSLSDKPLLTLGDLFSYIHLLQEAHYHPRHTSSLREKSRQDALQRAGALCSWSTKDIEKIENIIVKVLRAVGVSNWVAWRTLKGAAIGSGGSSEMIDYCLKGLVGKLIDDNLVVQSQLSVETIAIEFRLESYEKFIADAQRKVVKLPPDHLTRSLKFLYDSILDPITMIQFKPKEMKESILRAARKILDCKQFVRHFDEPPASLLPSNSLESHIWCHVELFDEPADYTSPPPELVVLPVGATIADLKLQAAKAFRETYIVFQKFQAEQIGYKSFESNANKLSDANSVVLLRGRCLGGEGKLGQFRLERGLENWEVDCTCGAKDDDGERMMACDVCGVWQHTRCAGIYEQEKVPEKFICIKCTGRCVSFSKSGG